MPSKEKLEAAQVYLELQEENENLHKQVHGLQKAAQDKEAYIHDLMSAHHKLIAVIQQAVDEQRQYDPDSPVEGLVTKIQGHLDSPPSSVAQEREARLSVFKKEK